MLSFGMLGMLALISGQAVIGSVIYVIVIGLIFWLLTWLIDYVAIPEPFNKIARVILAVAAVFMLIGVLLGMAGHPIFTW